MPNPTTVNANSRASGLFSAGSSSTTRRSASRDDTADPLPFDQVLETTRSQHAEAKPVDRDADRDAKAAPSKKSSRAAKPKGTAAKSKPGDASGEAAAQTAAAANRPVEAAPSADVEDADASETTSEDSDAIGEHDQQQKEEAKTAQSSTSDASGAAAAAMQVKGEAPATDANKADATPAKRPADATAAVSSASARQPKVAANLPSNGVGVDDAAADADADPTQQASDPATAAASADTVAAKEVPPKQADDAPVGTFGKALADPTLNIAIEPSKTSDDGQDLNQDSHASAASLDDLSDIVDQLSEGAEAFTLDAMPTATKKTAALHTDLNDAAPAMDLQAPLARSGAAHASPGAGSASAAPEARFATDNHTQIVNTVRANLLPNGGTMNIRLDPPELGDLQLIVHMRDGVMSASFQTSNDQATHLLSHSLGELRASLEASGVAVDKLHVEQAPRDAHARNDHPDARQQQGQAQDSPARRDQQRRELLQRMWRRLSEGSDPLDLVA